MRATTFASQSVYLLDLPPDGNGTFRADIELPSQTTVGLSNRETRRPYTAALRCHLAFTITASGVEARRMVDALRAWATEPILCPMWSAAVEWQDVGTRPLSSGIDLVFSDDWTSWEVYSTGTGPVGTPADTDTVVPLLWGRLETRAVKWVSSDITEFSVDFVETGATDYALVPASASFTAGPQPAAYATAPRLFPYQVDATEGPENRWALNVLRDSIGFGRGPKETVYQSTVARAQTNGQLFVTQSEAAQVIQFFAQHGGGKAFWVPTWTNAAVLSSDIAGGAVTALVTDTAAIDAGDYLAFNDPTQALYGYAKVNTISPALTLNLDRAPGTFDKRYTVVSHLLLCRFDKPRITLEWTGTDLASASLSFLELPPEIVPPETLGTSLGLLTACCYLYELTRTLDGTPTVSRYTSYERDVTLAGNTYTAGKWQHGDITRGIALDRDEVSITSTVFSGNPMLGLANLSAAGPLMLVIKSADISVATATNPVVLFTGEVTSVAVRGSVLTGKAVSGGKILDRKFPRLRLQPTCNWSLFDAACGLVKTNWKFSALVDNPGTAGHPYSFLLKTLAPVAPTAAPTFFAEWFAGGWIEFGSGLTWQRLPILSSTTVTAGACTVYTTRDPSPFPVANDPVILYPGCDGRHETCKAYSATVVHTGVGEIGTVSGPEGKFNNYLNFGGFPFVPVANPSYVKKSAAAGGGKK